MKAERAHRTTNRLSAQRVKTITEPGRHADGAGLYLVVDASGAKRWVFIYRWKANPLVAGAGRLREMGLGSAATVSLAEAREAALEARRLKQKGKDPISERLVDAGIPTFGVMAADVVKRRSGDMKSDKSIARIKRALEKDAAALSDMRVDAISTDDVFRVLRPIWTTKPASAKETRAYIEAVFDAAKARGFRKDENPARWKGNLAEMLESHKRRKPQHHSSMAYLDVPNFVAHLQRDGRPPAKALELLILTAARTSEILGARWSEMDLEANVWTVPAQRMKSDREHRVPLAPRAAELLRSLVNGADCDFVFPGQKADKSYSNMVFEMLLRRLKLEVTTHGFRSSFRDWVYEKTSFPGELAEGALSHVHGDATERAYRRGDALERRRVLMEAWAAYCLGDQNDNVIPLMPKASNG